MVRIKFRKQGGKKRLSDAKNELSKRNKDGVSEEARQRLSLGDKKGKTFRGTEQQTNRPTGRPSRKLKTPKPPQ